MYAIEQNRSRNRTRQEPNLRVRENRKKNDFIIEVLTASKVAADLLGSRDYDNVRGGGGDGDNLNKTHIAICGFCCILFSAINRRRRCRGFY